MLASFNGRTSRLHREDDSSILVREYQRRVMHLVRQPVLQIGERGSKPLRGTNTPLPMAFGIWSTKPECGEFDSPQGFHFTADPLSRAGCSKPKTVSLILTSASILVSQLDRTSAGIRGRRLRVRAPPGPPIAPLPQSRRGRSQKAVSSARYRDGAPWVCGVIDA